MREREGEGREREWGEDEERVRGREGQRGREWTGREELKGKTSYSETVPVNSLRRSAHTMQSTYTA